MIGHPLRLARVWWTGAVVLVVSLIVVTLISIPSPPTESNVDKIYHVIAYFVLMTYLSGLVPPARWLAVAMFATVLGGGLELAQGWIGNRSAEWLDLFANILGVVLGYFAAFAGLGRWCVALDTRLGTARR